VRAAETVRRPELFRTLKPGRVASGGTEAKQRDFPVPPFLSRHPDLLEQEADRQIGQEALQPQRQPFQPFDIVRRRLVGLQRAQPLLVGLHS